MSTSYKDEIVGRRVQVKFSINGDSSRTEFFPGTVQEYRVFLRAPKKEEGETDDDDRKILVRTHRILFDDGDEHSYEDIEKWEHNRVLEWLSDIPVKRELTVIEQVTSATTFARGPQVVKSEHVADDIEKCDEQQISVKKEAALCSNVEEVSVHVPTGIPSVIHTQRRRTTARKSSPTGRQSPSRKRRQRADNNNILSGDYSSRRDDDSSALTFEYNPRKKNYRGEERCSIGSDDIPPSITALVRLLDKLEPGKKYFERQADSRDECSKLRGKLRKFARANPKHPAVTHWVKTRNWEPPDRKTLAALMDLVKEMIDKTWPASSRQDEASKVAR